MMMGYAQLGNYLDNFERVLQAKKQHLLELDYKLLTAMGTGIRKMKKTFDELEKSDTESDFTKELTLLHNAAGTKIYI
jgi:hypothetical protein